MQTNNCQKENHDQKIENSKEINFDKFVPQPLIMVHYNVVQGMDICLKRNLLASGSLDKTVKLWNLENYSLIQTYHQFGSVFDLALSTEGNLLAFGGDSEYSVKLVDITYPKKDNIVSKLNGHTSFINRIYFSKNTKFLISGSEDKTLRIWGCQSKIKYFQLNSKSPVRGIAIRGDNTMIASNLFDGIIRIWDFQTRNLLCTQRAHESGCGIQFSNNSQMLVSSGFEGIVKLWRQEQFNLIKLVLMRKFIAGNSVIWTVILSACSRYILTMCNKESKIKVFNLQLGYVEKEFESRQQNNFGYHIGIAISKDTEIIAYGEDNKVIFLRMQ